MLVLLIIDPFNMRKEEEPFHGALVVISGHDYLSGKEVQFRLSVNGIPVIDATGPRRVIPGTEMRLIANKTPTVFKSITLEIIDIKCGNEGETTE